MAKTNNKSKAVKVDRRGQADRRQEDRGERMAIAADGNKIERRKVARRRQIDPTTCERDYSDDEIEFMQAMDAYKRANGRMFPTCSEILEVVRSLGYSRLGEASAPSQPVNEGSLDFEAEAEMDAFEEQFADDDAPPCEVG